MKTSSYVKSFIAILVGFSALPAWSVNAGDIRESLPEVRPVETESEFRPHVALMAGVSTPEGRYNTNAEYGLDVGYQPYIPFSIAAELSSATYNGEGDNTDLTRTKLLAKGQYNFGGEVMILKDSYIGLGIGPSYETANGSDVLYMSMMPNLGFDIPLDRKPEHFVSVGANARYLITNSDGPDVFALNGVMKYWF